MNHDGPLIELSGCDIDESIIFLPPSLHPPCACVIRKDKLWLWSLQVSEYNQKTILGG